MYKAAIHHRITCATGLAPKDVLGLTQSLSVFQVPENKRWSVKIANERFPDVGYIIDLTKADQNRFYDPAEVRWHRLFFAPDLMLMRPAVHNPAVSGAWHMGCAAHRAPGLSSFVVAATHTKLEVVCMHTMTRATTSARLHSNQRLCPGTCTPPPVESQFNGKVEKLECAG